MHSFECLKVSDHGGPSTPYVFFFLQRDGEKSEVQTGVMEVLFGVELQKEMRSNIFFWQKLKRHIDKIFWNSIFPSGETNIWT